MKRSTRSFVPLFALVVAFACSGAPTTAQDVTAFSNVTVLPMTSEEALPGQNVVVANGVIVQVGPATQVELPEGATVIDGDGRYLMPGLAEMHAHVPPVANAPQEELEDLFFLYLANGITTIRGMLGSAYQVPLADEVERGELLGPTFYVGAPSLNGRTATSPSETERLVRTYKEAGYDLQKIHPGVPLASWNRMVAVAEEVGITFGGHVPAEVGLVRAIETGISTVDHLDGYVEAVTPDGLRSAGPDASVNEDLLAEIIQLTVESDVYLVPTMYLWDNLLGIPDVDQLLAQDEMKYVSQQTRDSWRRRAEAAAESGANEGNEAGLRLRRRILKELSDAGAKILMGTDSPQLFNVPGFALHRELAVMSEAGMTNYEILKSGTVSVSEYVAGHLGLDGNFGTVAEGQRADLVLLGSNPLDDLASLQDRAGVMVRGRWIGQAEIEERLAALAAKYKGEER